MREIEFEGKTHSFPDDATDQEIEQVLSGSPVEPQSPSGLPDLTTQQIIEQARARTRGVLTPEGSEAFKIGIGEAATKTGQRVNQLFSSPERAAEIGSNAAYDENLLQSQISQESPVFQGSQRLGKFTGMMAPALAVPGPGALGITSVLGRVGYSAGVGGGFGIVSGEPVKDKTQFVKEGAVGTLVGGGLQTGIEAVSLIPRKLGSLFTSTGEAEKSGGLLKPNPIYEQGLKTEQSTGVTLAPGQLTGAPSLSEMKAPREFTNKQTSDTVRYFKSLRDRITGSKTQTPPQLADKFDKVTNDVFGQLVEARRKVGNYAYGKFKTSVKEIQSDTLMSKMDDIAKDAVPGTDEGIVINLRDKLSKQLEESGGSLTPEQFLGWKQRIDDLLAGKSDIFKNLKSANQQRIGAQLSDALWMDVKKTADMLELSGKSSPARLLKEAHQKYSAYSKPIDQLKESALGALFKSGEKFNPDTIGQKLMNLQPSEVNGMYGVLQKYYPSGLKQYQATKLYNSMKQGVATTAETAGRTAGESKFNPKSTLAALNEKGSLREVFSKDPELMRGVNRGVALLDRLSDRLSIGSGGTQSIGTVGKQAAQIAASQNAIFSAGFLAQHLGPLGLWKLTSTEGGRSLLKTLATAPLQGPKFTAATVELTNNYLNEAAQ